MATTAPKTGPGLAISLIVLTGGFVLAIVGFVVAMRIVSQVAMNDPYSVPGTIEESFETGSYEVYAESVELLDLFDETTEDDEFLGQADNLAVTVRDPSGQILPVSSSNPARTTSRGFTLYQHVGDFEVVESGVHVIEVGASEQTTLVVGRTFESALGRAVPWMIATGIGSILALAGLIMLVVGIVRRQRASKTQPFEHHPGIHTPVLDSVPPPPPGQTLSPQASPPPPPPPTTPNQTPPPPSG